MATKWLEEYISNLAKLLKEPPYLIFVFMGGIFVIISLISKYEFKSIWIFFLYSVGGTMWRYAERDFLGIARDTKKIRLRILSQIIYHIGNIALFLMLVRFLDLI